MANNRDIKAHPISTGLGPEGAYEAGLERDLDARNGTLHLGGHSFDGIDDGTSSGPPIDALLHEVTTRYNR